MSAKKDTPKQSSYTPAHQWRFVILLFIVAGLIYALFNYRSWLDRDPNFDTKHWVAFISDQNGNPDLWVADAAGALNALTNDEYEEDSPVWTQNGNRIIFSSTRPLQGIDKQVFQLFSIRPDGSGVKGLTVGGGAKLSPSVSQDGRRVLHVAQGFVNAVDIQTNAAEQLVPSADDPQAVTSWRNMFGEGANVGFRRVAWSPSNNNFIAAQLAPDRSNALFFAHGHEHAHDHSAEGHSHDHSGVVPVFVYAAERLGFSWSPVEPNLLLAFQGAVPPSDVMRLEGGQPAQAPPLKNGLLLLTVVPRGEYDPNTQGALAATEEYVLTVRRGLDTGEQTAFVEPAFSPDGTRFAVVIGEMKDGNLDRRQLAVMDTAPFLNPNEPVPPPTVLVEGAVGAPVWSPDGSKIAYVVYNPGGKRDIWTVDANGSNAKNLTNGKGDNWQPVWSSQK